MKRKWKSFRRLLYSSRTATKATSSEAVPAWKDEASRAAAMLSSSWMPRSFWSQITKKYTDRVTNMPTMLSRRKMEERIATFGSRPISSMVRPASFSGIFSLCIILAISARVTMEHSRRRYCAYSRLGPMKRKTVPITCGNRPLVAPPDCM